MQKVLLLLPLLLLITTNAYSWHFEYLSSYGEGVGIRENSYFRLSDDILPDTINIGYSYINHVENSDGSVDVNWDVGSTSGLSGDDSFTHLEFQIVSDYGNTSQTPVEVDLFGSAGGGISIEGDNREYIRGGAELLIYMFPDFDTVGMVDIYGMEEYPPEANFDDMTDIDETVELLSNTLYNIDFHLSVGGGLLVEEPPSYFDSIQEMEDFFNENGDSGFAELSAGGGYGLDVEIRSVETVPVPASVFLFVSGLMGLVGISRKF